MDVTEYISGSRMRLGSRIKNLRREQRLSQEQLAHMVGCDRTLISRMERGKCTATLDTVILIADVLGIPASLLLEDVDKAKGREAVPVHLDMPKAN